MPSPFPGMNPYLEQSDLWRGFHGGFLFCLHSAITPQVVPRYYVEYEESLYIDRAAPFAVADVAVAHPERNGAETSAEGGATAAPVTATVPMPKLTRKKRKWLTIRDGRDRTVVTVIEVLSPSDKRGGKDRERYLEKRDRILRSSAHLVEIDLLRGGQRPPVDTRSENDYRIVVSRRPDRPHVGVWPIGLRDALPTIPIPLRTGEPEPTISLKAVLDRVYDEMGFAHRIYQGTPEPPLSAADAEWAKAFLPAPA
jgi:hypothetical protein